MNRQMLRVLSIFVGSFIAILFLSGSASATGKGVIGDRVWNDINGNGIQDPGEPGIDGVGVKLCDCDHVVLDSTTTANGGFYEFSGLESGCYIVSFDPVPDLELTEPNQGYDDNLDSDPDPASGETEPIQLDEGDNDKSIDAGLRSTKSKPTAQLGNKVWNDVNQNGKRNFEDDGVPGVQVDLLAGCSGTTVLGTTITDETGWYGFKRLPAGLYRIRVTLPDGYVFSPQNNSTSDENDSDVDVNTGISDCIDLDEGENDPTNDVGIYKPAPNLGSIGDRVFNDTDQDGIQDPGESGVPGVTVLLKDCDGIVLQSTTTDGNGNYLFGDLPAGCYAIGIVAPRGFVISPADQGGDDATDSDVDPSTAMTDPIDLSAGEDDPTNDAGIYQPAPELGSIGDRVWLDNNRNGLQDQGEPGVAGISVLLEDCNNNTVDSTTTDSNGNYNFADLNAGCYVVRFANINSNIYGFTLSDQGTDDALDSDITSSDSVTPGIINGETDPINLGQGENNPTIDAGLVSPPALLGSIGDRVFNDADEDGVQDPGEPGVPGVTVQLKDCNNNILQTTLTDNNGNYSFTDLTAGCYRIGIVPNGFQISPQDQGDDDRTDSDVDPNTAMTGDVNLAPGEDNPTVDAGVFTPNGSIGDTVFDDVDGDGIQDPNEPGVELVEVQLKDCNGNILDTTITNSDGNYLFDNLDAGCYIIGIVPPFDRTLSPQDQGGDDTADSDVNPDSAMTDQINLDQGEDDPTVDAGLVSPSSSVGDTVFDDLDSDGVQDPGEPGVPGVTVDLKDCNDNILQTTTTDGNGNYLFDNLDAGCYSIGVVLPDGRSFSPQDQGGNDATDSDIDPTNAMSPQFDLASDEDNLTIDAGLVTAFCGLGLTHTCQVIEPPSGALECESKVAAATFRYVGPSINGATVVFSGKDGQASYNVDLISGETILTGQNGYTIDARPDDLGSKMQITINGVSEGEGVHTSCSAPFVAGQPAPLNDPKGAPSSNWVVESFVEKDGRTVSLPGPGTPSQQCVITPGSGDVCSGDKPSSFTLRYTGGSCSASNNAQGSKFKCEGGDPNPSNDPNAAVTISSKKGGSRTVQLGDEFTLDKDGLKELTVSGSGGSQSLEIHTSCSAPIRLGDVYGALTLVGADGQRLDTQVILTYEVFNGGSDLSNVSVQDDLVGAVAGPFALLSGLSQTFEEIVTIEEAITNVATATGSLVNGTMCSAQDSVTIEVEERPSGLSCSDGKPQQLIFEYTGESCSASSNTQGSKFDCSGTPSDGTVSINVLKDSDKFNVSPGSVSLGDSITVSSSEGKKLKSSLELNIGGQTLDIHTSCSAPLAVGDQFGSLLLTDFFPEGSVNAATRLDASQITDSVFLPFMTGQ